MVDSGSRRGRSGSRRLGTGTAFVGALVIGAVVAACAPSVPPPTGSPTSATTEGLTFVPATWNNRYVEESSYNDDGGVLHVRVDNPASTPDRVSEVRVNGLPVESLPGLRWWRVWPPDMGPAGSPTASSVVTIKSTGAPIRGDQAVDVTVRTEGGHQVSRSATLRAAKLRVGSIVATRDRSALKVFIRNRSAETFTLNHLAVNDDVRIPGSDPSVSTPNGSWTVEPDRVLVATIQLDAPAATLAPIALQVGATSATGEREWVMGSVRLIDTDWDMGTWYDVLRFRPAENRRAAKEFQIDQVVSGAGAELDALWEGWGVQGNTVVPGPADVAAQQGNPAIRSWLIADEPDLSTDPFNSSTSIAARVDQVKRLDPTHPTWVNFAMGRKFNEFGPIPDITGMDHYVHCWANIVLGSGWSRINEMREALDYTDMLKDNTEPLPMWIWPQLGSGSSECQPTAYGVSTQFWMSVMGGADGINWFLWEGDLLSDPRFAEPNAQAARDSKVARQVRDLLSFGEVEQSVTSSNPLITTRAIVGEEHQVVVACNLNYATNGPPWSTTFQSYPVSGSLTVDVPDWIDPSTVRRVTPGGTTDAAATVVGQTVTLPVAFDEECPVFTIGAADLTAPTAPAHVRRPEPDTLAWVEANDNLGVAGYRVLRDSVVVATTSAAVFRSPDVSTGVWTIEAVDSAGNVSAPSLPAV